MAGINQRVLVDPAETRRIRTDPGLYTFWGPEEHAERVFQGSRACPVEVGPIFEDERNVRVSEVGKSANRLYVPPRPITR
jgi:hypothetical protein